MATPSPGLPAGSVLRRTTPELTADTVPDGLRRAHRIADGVWGVLRVREGEVRFVLEDTGAVQHLSAGDAQVIEPGVAHHVEPGPTARFVVEFHRPPTVSGPDGGT